MMPCPHVQLTPPHPPIDACAHTPPTGCSAVLRQQGRTADYDVIVLYDQEEESPSPLLTAPTFWKPISGCNGAVPVPDATWVSLTPLRAGDP